MKQGLEVIDKFSDDYDFLSNFYPVVIQSGGIKFKTVEHAYQASKSSDHNIWMKISNLDADEAGKAKHIGRKVKLRKDWDMLKISVMRRFLMEKFTKNVTLRKKLLETGNAFLIEGNYWHDNYWGDCKCEKCKNMTGGNQLGLILMKIRNEIKKCKKL